MHSQMTVAVDYIVQYEVENSNQQWRSEVSELLESQQWFNKLIKIAKTYCI